MLGLERDDGLDWDKMGRFGCTLLESKVPRSGFEELASQRHSGRLSDPCCGEHFLSKTKRHCQHWTTAHEGTTVEPDRAWLHLG